MPTMYKVEDKLRLIDFKLILKGVLKWLNENDYLFSKIDSFHILFSVQGSIKHVGSSTILHNP